MSFLNFKGIHHIGDDTLGDLVEKNLVAWLDWCCLNIGGYFNVERPQTGAFGGDWSKLHLADANGFAKGRVWEGVRKNWIYESGVNYSPSPMVITGIWLNNSGFPVTGLPSGYACDVNYPLGRVEFSSAIPTGTTVQVAYSHKYYSFETSKVPWFRELSFGTFRADEDTLDQYGSGERTVYNENRIQLPAVVVEVTPNRSFTGIGLGGGQWVKIGVRFHIYGENPWDATKMVDILTMQNRTTVSGFDLNTMAEQSGMPLTPEGYTWSGTKNYPELLSAYPWGNIWLEDISGQDFADNTAVVRATCQLYCPGL
jgi:hypothetical protein